MPRTSNKAQLIVDYVNEFIQENGYSPSVREIGAAVGLRSTASVSYHLQAPQGTMPWGDPGCFALRVRGDSMINAGILSGDKVVVRPQANADDGQIVVARIGDEATVKRLRRRSGKVWLMPENDAYEPIDGTEAEIIGLVKAVVREY